MNTGNTQPRLRRRRMAVGAFVLALGAGTLIAPVVAGAEPTVPEAPVISTETAWRYLDDNTDPARGDADIRAWTRPGYDDSSWKSATGGFGAKNGKLAAVGPYLPKTVLQHYIDGVQAPAIPTYFFRTTFTVPAGVLDKIASLSGEIVYDDAVVVWVNGQKVAGFVDGRVTGTTNLEYAGSNGGNPVKSLLEVSSAALTEGDNTIAVALYQDREASSDIYFEAPSLKLTPKSDTGGEPGGEPGEGGETPQAAPSRIVLTPGPDLTTSQAFSWLAGEASHTTGEVQIAPAAGGETRAIAAYDAGTVNGNPQRHFSATVTGLTPNTEYRYRVGTERSWSEWKTFRTANPNATEFQYVYYGDAQIGLDTTWPKVVQAAEAKAPNSIGSVHAGDLINTGTNDTEWKNWFKGMEQSAATTNIFAAPGNHEYTGDALLKSWKAHFEYQENNPTTGTIGELAARAQGDSDVARQYAAYFEHWQEFAKETVYFADYGNIRFITLNATRDAGFLKPANLPACTGAECPSTMVARVWTEYQAAWLDHVLEQSPQKWNVVTFHQPVFSGSAGRDEPVLRELWVPVFQKHNIDLVQMGHDHVYARGFVNADKTDTEGMTSGPVYMVSNSGAKHYDLETDAKNVWTNNGATQVKRAQDVTTYQVVTVSKNSLHYASYVVETTKDFADPTVQPGDLFDEFTVTKYDDGTKYVTEAGMTPPAEKPGEGGEWATIALPNASVTQGGVLRGAVTGLEPGTQIRAVLHSEPIEAQGVAPADAQGTTSFEIAIPADFETGTHRLVISSEGKTDIERIVTIAAKSAPGGTDQGPGTPGNPNGSTGTGGKTGGLAVTGATAMPLIGAAAAMLLVAGAALLVVRRRKAAAVSAEPAE